MKVEQLLSIQSALENAEKRLLAANRDKPIEPIRKALDEISEAQQIVKFQLHQRQDKVV